MLNKLHNKIPIQVLNELGDVMSQFSITNSFRLTHFLAQTAHESGNFRYTRENLNYSEEGLLKVFPKYFDKNTAGIYARKPEMIANIVYELRMGNGDKNSGDGWKYRGRGYIQLTGKTNYKTFGDYIGVNLLDNPDLVATKYALTSAAWYFEKNKLWDICDQGIHNEIVKRITYRVNGGYNGLADRLSKTNVIFNLIL